MDNEKKCLAEIEYDYFVNCYEAYNQGQDDFPREAEDLNWDLMDLYDVNDKALGKLEDMLKQLQRENNDLKLDSGEVGALAEPHAKILGDILSLQEYQEKTHKYLMNKQADLKATIESISKLKERQGDLKASIHKNEQVCLEKGINPKDSSIHTEETILTLQRRVEAKKAEVSEAGNLKWKFEKNVAKKIAILDKHK